MDEQLKQDWDNQAEVLDTAVSAALHDYVGRRERELAGVNLYD